MAQATNSAALIRLQPLQGNDIGSLVEEHVRYWRKYKDDQEADDIARQAAEAKYKRDVLKDRESKVPEIGVGDAVGMYRAQIVEGFEADQDRLADLTRRWVENGDKEALQQLNQAKRQYNEAGLLIPAAEKTAQYILENKEKLYNPYLDEDLLTEWESLAKGRSIYKDGKLVIFKPDGSAYEKRVEEVSSAIGNFKFSGKPDFARVGNDFAGQLKLDVGDGNMILTSQKEQAAITMWKNHLLEDKLARDTALSMMNFPKDKEITKIELNRVARQLYEDHTRHKIQQKTNAMDNALKAERLAKLRADRLATQEQFTTLSLSTDEQGRPLNQLKADVPYVMSEGDRIFNLKGQPISFGVQGNNKTNTTYTDLIRSEDGRIFAVGRQVEKIEETLKDDEGNIIYNADQITPKTKTRENAVEILEYDPRILNNLVRLLEDNEGRQFENLQEASIFMDNLIQNPQTRTRRTTTQTPQDNTSTEIDDEFWED